MRDSGLRRSVARLLGDNEKLVNVVYMSALHRLAVPFIGASAVVLVGLAIWLGFEEWPQRVSLGIAGGTIAAISTTEHRVLAHTSRGLVMLRSSRVRRRAVAIKARLNPSILIEAKGSNLVLTEYAVGPTHYFVSRRYQSDMNAIISR